MKEAPEYLVCYDISQNKERTRVERILKGYGFRVQKSVFECRLTRSSKTGLIVQLERLLIKSGSIKIYRIYGGANSVVIGQPMLDPDDGFAYAF